MIKKIALAFALLAAVSVFNSCSLTLSGSSIPDAMKTINVEFFENNAPFVVNNLSQQFTEALKDRVRSQTKLSIVRTPDADGDLSGSIIGYTIAPVSVQATGNTNTPPIANASRLTITVKVKYTNKDPSQKKWEFDQEFSKYADFTGDIAAKEQALIAQINKDLTEDIFNKAFANW